MRYIQINSGDFNQAQTMSLVDYLAKKPASDRLILDCRTVTQAELETLLAATRTRFIVYGFATAEQATRLEAHGDFDLTDQWQDKDLVKQLDFLFDDQLFTQGWSAAPDEAAIISEQLPGRIVRKGRYEMQFEGSYGSKQLALTWLVKTENWMKKSVVIPFRRLYKGGRIRLEFDWEATGSVAPLFDLEINGEHHYVTGHELLLDLPAGATVGLRLYLSGEGRFRLGKIWTFRDKYGKGDFLMGDQRTVTPNGETIYSYYLPGKIKRKMIVGFSGALNEVPQYERQGMAKFGFPVLLFMDVRNRSGVYQLGKDLDPAYEASLVAIIDQKLAENGLTRKDLIFTGWSMGSYPAMYYGTLMQAGHIIPCKPIVNLGDVTADKSLIYRTDGSMIGTREYLCGRTDLADTPLLNRKLADLVERQDMSGTMVYAFFMLQDELDRAMPFYDHYQDKFKAYEKVSYMGFHGDARLAMGQYIATTIERIKDNLS